MSGGPRRAVTRSTSAGLPAVLRGLLVLMACAGWCASASAQEGELILDVFIEGEVGIDHALLEANLRTRVGRPYLGSFVEEDTRFLANEYGLLAEAQLEPGPRVRFLLARIRRFDSFEIVGNDSISTRELFSAARLNEDGDATPDEVARARDLVREHYLGKGYAFVQVDLRLDKDQRSGEMWIFEGPRVKVDEVVVEGLTALDQGDALRLLGSNPPWWSFVFGHDYQQSIVDRDLVLLESFVRGEGYLDARVAQGQLRWLDGREKVAVVMSVDEGERYVVRSVSVEGNAAISTEELLKDAEIVAGSPYRRADLGRVVRRMLGLYGEQGYIEARVQPEAIYDEFDAVLDLVWDVEESNQKTVRDVIVRGNTGTRDDVIRRQLTVYPGDVVDTSELRWSEDALVALGYFTDAVGTPKVRVSTEDTPDPGMVDVIVEVADNESGLFSFLVGAGSDSGIFGGVSVDKRNFDIRRGASSWGQFLDEVFGTGGAFHGGGQRLFLEILPGTETTQAEIMFQDPWLDSSAEEPWGLTANLYDRRRVFDDYDRENTGFYLGFDHKLTREQSISLGARIENVDISDVDGGAGPAIRAAEGDANTNTLEASWRYEDLDSRSSPTSGFATGVRFENAGTVLGSDNELNRLVATGEYYQAIHEDDDGNKSVLHSRMALGVVDGEGDLDPVRVAGPGTPLVPGSPEDDDLPFYENFFVGGTSGPFAMRGFEFQGLGPHQSGEAIGGELAMVLSVEALVPLVTRYNPFRDREESTVKGVAFVEAGNLRPDSGDWGDLGSDLRVAAGIGARVRLPALGGVTLAIDWAPFVSDQDEDETRSFSFELARRF